MALTVKKATLWRRELENTPGTLAEALKPFAQAGISLEVVMGYTFPRPDGRGVVEVYPVVGAKAEQAAKEAGMSPATGISCLLVEDQDRAGVGYEAAQAIAQAGINLHFAMFQVIQGRYVGVFGFGSEQEANQAEGLIRKIAEVHTRA